MVRDVTTHQKLVGAEMKRLTGEGDDVCGSSDEEDDSEEPERKTMKLDFDANVDSVFNKKVVDRASGLVFDEQTVSFSYRKGTVLN
jgi:hypothetical protein